MSSSRRTHSCESEHWSRDLKLERGKYYFCKKVSFDQWYWDRHIFIVTVSWYVIFGRKQVFSKVFMLVTKIKKFENFLMIIFWVAKARFWSKIKRFQKNPSKSIKSIKIHWNPSKIHIFLNFLLCLYWELVLYCWQKTRFQQEHIFGVEEILFRNPFEEYCWSPEGRFLSKINPSKIQK